MSEHREGGCQPSIYRQCHKTQTHYGLMEMNISYEKSKHTHTHTSKLIEQRERKKKCTGHDIPLVAFVFFFYYIKQWQRFTFTCVHFLAVCNHPLNRNQTEQQKKNHIQDLQTAWHTVFMRPSKNVLFNSNNCFHWLRWHLEQSYIYVISLMIFVFDSMF